MFYGGRKKVVKTTMGTIIIYRKVFPSATGTLKNLTIKFLVYNPARGEGVHQPGWVDDFKNFCEALRGG